MTEFRIGDQFPFTSKFDEYISSCFHGIVAVIQMGVFLVFAVSELYISSKNNISTFIMSKEACGLLCGPEVAVAYADLECILG